MTASRERPLSPHLQIYRWQITMVLSILHRLTGAALSAGSLVLAWWLIAAAMGAEAYQGFQAAAGSLPGRILLILWAFALFYHLCNGVRHLFWDAGWGFGLETLRRSGWTVVILSVLLTVAAAWLGGLW